MGDSYKGNMFRPQATFVLAIALAGGGAGPAGPRPASQWQPDRRER